MKTNLTTKRGGVAVAEGLESRTLFAVTPSGITTDWNLDGNPDLVVRNEYTGTNQVRLLDVYGDTYSTINLPSATNTSWKLADAADLNGDSRPDLVFRNLSTGSNAVWYMGYSTRYSVTFLPSALNLNWRIGAVSDMDEYGDYAIAWRNVATGANAVWQMNVNGGVEDIYSLPSVGDQNWQIVSIGDLDTDGPNSLAPDDLVWHHYGNGNTAYWIMSRNVFNRAQVITPPAGSSWFLGDADDYDNDGKVDVLWQNSFNGNSQLWHYRR